jgi:uncharacterized protein (TIGR02145 family)
MAQVHKVKTLNLGNGISTTSIVNSSAALQLDDTTRGFLLPRMTDSQRNTIDSPAVGLTIFNTTSKCIEWFNGYGWYSANGNSPISTSSGGTAIVNAYSCNAPISGSLISGSVVSNVSKTISANVSVIGTYNISVSSNGVTFSGSGVFLNSGNQDIILTASGTPTTSGDITFSMLTDPSCSFVVPIFDGSTNGTAIVNSYDCSTASSGDLTVGIDSNGSTQTILANVTAPGTYSLKAIKNGVIFTSTGSFSTTGPQQVVLNASGIPLLPGTHSFQLNTSISCSFTRDVYSLTSNGTSIISRITYNGSLSGSSKTMIESTDPGYYGYNINVDVLTPGTYSFLTPGLNGVYFLSSGQFLNPGSFTVTLRAFGVPVSGGVFTYLLNSNLGFNYDISFNSLSTNGTSKISSLSCSTNSIGKLVKGTNSTGSGATQTITVNVTQKGTYDFSAVTSGVTFAAAGIFDNLGLQNVLLTAKGTPSVSGTLNFSLNTIPACTFTRNVIEPSTNGTAVVSSYANGTSTGTLINGVPVSGVTQTISANVTSPGTYNLTIVSNGVTFESSGTFTNTGSQNIVLTASGTPSFTTSSVSFALNTTPTLTFTRTINSLAICDTTKPTMVVDVVSTTGKTWMDRNLGAERLASSSTDYLSYGCKYQWGRGNDGHANINYSSSTSQTAINASTATLATSPTVTGNSSFIYSAGGNWFSVINNDLWQGVSGVNNPCPSGYRLPTKVEFENELVTLNITSNSTAYGSLLKLTTTGNRSHNVASNFGSTGTGGMYWTSTLDTTSPNTKSMYLSLSSSTAVITANLKTYGFAVRCIKD